MKLTLDQVKKVAKLANLQLTGEEEELYSEQISKILGYMDKLNEVDTEGVEPVFNIIKYATLADDAPSPSLSQEEALQNAHAERNGMFITKGVFEE